MPTSSPIPFYFKHSSTPLSEKVRFALRHLFLSRFQICPLWAVLQDSPTAIAPEIVCKVMEAPQRLYYDSRYGYNDRVDALCDHHLFLFSHLPASVCSSVLNKQPYPVAHYIGKNEGEYQLRLCIDHQMEKEGSLTLELTNAEQAVMRCTWHFAKNQASKDGHGESWVVRVGCMQSASVNTLEALKQTTKDWHGIQPRILMLQALRAVCQAVGIHRIEGIGSAHHVYNSRRYRKSIALDYDQLWSFLGFEGMPNGNFVTDTLIPIKDLQDCPNNKRSEYRRRNESLESLQSQILQALNSKG